MHWNLVPPQTHTFSENKGQNKGGGGDPMRGQSPGDDFLPF